MLMLCGWLAMKNIASAQVIMASLCLAEDARKLLQIARGIFLREGQTGELCDVLDVYLWLRHGCFVGRMGRRAKVERVFQLVQRRRSAAES